MSYQDAKYAQQTSPQSTTLTRHGDRYGLRSDVMNASEIHAKHRPDTPLLLGQTKSLYTLGPLPFSSTKKAVAKILKSWDWDARPMQPRGRAPDSTGVVWTIQAVEDPTHWIYNSMAHPDVLITKLTSVKENSQPKVFAIIASRRTLDSLENKETNEVDPWIQNDPWKPATHSQPKSHLPAVAQAALSNAQIAAIETNMEKKLRQDRPEEDASMMPTAIEERVTQLEQDLQHVHASQAGLETKITQIQHQVEQQSVQFSQALDQKLDNVMQQQMERIEHLHFCPSSPSKHE